MLTKEAIHGMASSYEILDHFLKPYHNFSKLTAGKNISNPFVAEKQKTPSFNIFCSSPGQHWRYKDFATDDEGDCFSLVQKLFNLSFPEALKKVNDDMQLCLTDNEPSELQSARVPVVVGTRIVQGSNYSITIKPYSQKELAFWLKYGITYDTLMKYSVVSVQSFSSVSKEGKPYTITNSENNPIFAFENEHWCKIYKPLAKDFRFQFLGLKPEGYIYGYEQLPMEGDLLIIASGGKDGMALAARGFNVIWLNSETDSLKDEVASDLKHRFKNVIVIYDIDATGLEKSQKLCQLLGFKRLILPNMDKGKDVADYFEGGNSVENFQNLLTEILSNENAEKGSGTLNQQPSTPLIPDSVYINLPGILAESCSLFEGRARDVYFTGALCVLSGCLANAVAGTYRQSTIYPCLMSVIIAPPASDKSALKYAKALGKAIHDKLLAQSLAEKKEFKEATKKCNADSDALPPDPPHRKELFMPGNSSHANLISLLNHNDGRGIILETEASTLADAFKQMWGDYTTLICCAFGHEPVTYSRKVNDEFINIDCPRLAMALSGTKENIPAIVASVGGGLFSRLMHYTFEPPRGVWENVAPDPNKPNLDKLFHELSKEVMVKMQWHERFPATFSLTCNQWDKFNIQFKKWLEEIVTIFPIEIDATIKRLGIIAYRIAMVLATLRRYDNRDESDVIFCSDQDFEKALSLVDIYKQHAFHIFRAGAVTEKKMTPREQRMMELLNNLPDAFTRKQAVEVGKQNSMSDSAVDQYLRDLLAEKHLILPLHIPNVYRKVGK